MSEEKEVTFTFDEQSYFTLKEMTKKKDFDSVGDTISDSLALNNSLQIQAEQGFSEVIVRNPKTGKERIMYKSEL